MATTTLEVRLVVLLRVGRVQEAAALVERRLGAGASDDPRAFAPATLRGLGEALGALTDLLDGGLGSGPDERSVRLGDLRLLWRPLRAGAYEEAWELASRLLGARPGDHRLWLAAEALRVVLRFLHRVEGRARELPAPAEAEAPEPVTEATAPTLLDHRGPPALRHIQGWLARRALLGPPGERDVTVSPILVLGPPAGRDGR